MGHSRGRLPARATRAYGRGGPAGHRSGRGRSEAHPRAPGPGPPSCTGRLPLMSWRCRTVGPPAPDRHTPRPRGYPEDPRALGGRPLRAPSPGPAPQVRRRHLIGTTRGARRTPSCLRSQAPSALIRPVHWSIDGGGLSRLASRSPGPACSTREKVADVHCGIGSCGVPRPSLADYVTVMGPADRAPAAGGC